MNRRTVWIAASVLVLASCGGSSASDTSSGADASTTIPKGDTPTDTDGNADSSLAAFLGWDTSDDPAAAEAESRRQQMDIEESIRLCMAEQGFEYSPVLPPEGSFATFDPDDEADRVATEGFGITTWYGNEEMNAGVEWDDPNQDRVETMTPAEQDAYWAALHGDQSELDQEVEIDPETGEEMYVSSGFGGGCQGGAYEEAYGDQEATEELWEQLEPALEALNARMEADPRIVELNAEWAACMTEAGYTYESRNAMYDDIYESFQTRLDEIMGPDSDPLAGMTEDELNAFFELPADEQAAIYDERMADITDQPALQELQQEEIALAVADNACGEGFYDAYIEVSEEYEAELIAGNRDILEQIRDLQGTS